MEENACLVTNVANKFVLVMIQVKTKCASEMFGRILHLIILLFITSCTTDEDKAPVLNYGLKEKGNSKPSYALMKDPVLFLGSTFGQFFQMLHKTGDYEQMLTYTCKKTKSNFSRGDLLLFYQQMNFSYPLKLKAYKNGILYYRTTIGATQSTLQMHVVIENDTCKITFDTLKIQKPFVGL